MTDVPGPDDVEVRDCVAVIATRLEKQIQQISVTIRTAIENQVPELGRDARMSEMLAAGVQANLQMIVDALLRDTPVDELSAPAARWTTPGARHSTVCRPRRWCGAIDSASGT